MQIKQLPPSDQIRRQIVKTSTMFVLITVRTALHIFQLLIQTKNELLFYNRNTVLFKARKKNAQIK